MTSIARSRIGTGRSKLAVSRERCVSPSLNAVFSIARHISAIGGPACWWSGCHGPRVNELGRYVSPSNAAYALDGIDSVDLVIPGFPAPLGSIHQPRKAQGLETVQ